MSNISYLPTWFVLGYILITGLCIGSFLNVAILRGLSGEPIVFSRSKCPKCNNRLKWYMNIPVISYLFLKGKCAFCKEHISLQYPIVETLNALLYIASYFAFGLTLKFVFSCIFLSLFLAMTVTDIKEAVIVDYHAYILAAVGFIASFFNLFYTDWKGALIGAIVGFILFELLSWLGQLICNQRMFGFGDSLIILGLGTIFGLKYLIVTVGLAILIQVISSLPILVKNTYNEGKKSLFISYILIFISIFAIIFAQSINENIRLIYSTIVSIVLLISLKPLIDEIKEKKKQINNDDSEDEKFEKSPFCLLPFGPALLISAGICLFYINNIKTLLVDYFF